MSSPAHASIRVSINIHFNFEQSFVFNKNLGKFYLDDRNLELNCHDIKIFTSEFRRYPIIFILSQDDVITRRCVILTFELD